MSALVTIHGDAEAKQYIGKVIEALQPRNIDPVVERAAQKTLVRVVALTPGKDTSRWPISGMTKKSWIVEKPEDGMRTVTPRGDRAQQVIVWLEEGTKDHGPVSAGAMFIPLTPKAVAAYGENGFGHLQSFKGTGKNREFGQLKPHEPPTHSREEAALKNAKQALDRMKNAAEKFGQAKYGGGKRARGIRTFKRAVAVGTAYSTGVGSGTVLVYGKDYILAKKVKGVKPHRIVAQGQQYASQMLYAEATVYLKQATGL